MRQLILFTALVLVSACSGEEPSRRPVMVFSQKDFDSTYLWGQAPDGLGDTPALVIAKHDSLDPIAPDAEVMMTCEPDGSLEVWGNAYRFATDVGGPPQLMPMFGLRSRDLSLLGEPIWEHGGYQKSAHYVLRPSKTQLRQLLGGPWFEVSEVFSDGSGATRYPPPPSDLANAFIRQCQAIT